MQEVKWSYYSTDRDEDELRELRSEGDTVPDGQSQ